MKFQVKWTLLKPSPDPTHCVPSTRSSHGLSLVQKGSRLISYGGEHVARTPIEKESALWAIDLIKQNDNTNEAAWRHIAMSADKSPMDRLAHGQAVYDDKYVYIFGGRAGIAMDEKAMNDLWVLDCSGPPGSETWSEVIAESGGDPPPEPRSFHRMICIGSSLYVFGGCGADHGRLADLHRFDIPTRTWHTLPVSTLRGRGGPNVVPMDSGAKIGVIGGFCGEETRDGHLFDIAAGQWHEALLGEELQAMRPRSVCVAGAFPTLGVVAIFGGEVDPSDRGHEGAGGFENDLVLLDEKTGALLENIAASSKTEGDVWPENRGWADAAACESNGIGELYVFGGLAGDDENPRRLDDLWKLELSA